MFRHAVLATLLGGLLVPLGAVPAHAEAPTLSIDDVTVTEPLPGEGWVAGSLTVRLSQPATEPVSFAYQVAGGPEGREPTTGTSTLYPGGTWTTISLRVSNNGRYDAEPLTYLVTITSIQGAVIDDGSASLTVLNIDPNGLGMSCQATMQRESVAGAATSTGVANPEFTPCRNDVQRGDDWSSVTGDAEAHWVDWGVGPHWRMATADARRQEFRHDTVATTVAVQSVNAQAELRCSSNHVPTLVGYSTVSGLYVYADNPVDHWGNPPLADYWVGGSEPLDLTLPDGTTVGVNRVVREPYEDAAGEQGQQITVQSLVLISPTGDETVHGEARIAYVGDPCAP